MRSKKWVDRIGWVIEKGFIIIICTLYIIIFLGNKLLLVFDSRFAFVSLDQLLSDYYVLLINPNIGTITTIAAIFVGIYITVLSVLGSIKANSLIAFFSGRDLKKVISFIASGLTASFVVVFYSLIAEAFPEFIKQFLFFLLILYMLLTALRLGVNLVLIYSHDLKNLSENLKKEKEEMEKNKNIMFQLEQFLIKQEAERLRNRR